MKVKILTIVLFLIIPFCKAQKLNERRSSSVETKTKNVCNICGIYLQENGGEECIELYDTIIFHFWNRGKDPANSGIWKLVDNKIRWYSIPKTFYVGYENEYKQALGNKEKIKNLLSKIILQKNIMNTIYENKFEELNYDLNTKKIAFTNGKSFIKKDIIVKPCNENDIYGKYQRKRYYQTYNDQGYFIIKKDKNIEYYEDQLSDKASITGSMNIVNNEIIFSFNDNSGKVFKGQGICEENNILIISPIGEFVKIADNPAENKAPNNSDSRDEKTYKCGEKFIGKVWYSDKGIVHSFQEKHDNGSSTIIIKIEKVNDVFYVYYWDRSGSDNIDKFIVTCDNNIFKGVYNEQNITLSISENGDLIINQYKIQSSGNILTEWNKNKSEKDEDVLFNDFEHSKFACFLMWYDFFSMNNQTGYIKNFLRQYKYSTAIKYNTTNTGDIGIGEDKNINKRYREDIIKKIEQKEY